MRLQCRRPWFYPWVGKMCWRRHRLPTPIFSGFACDSAGKQPAHNAGDQGSISGLGKIPGEGKGYPLQYSGLENSKGNSKPMGPQRVGHNQLSDFHSHTHSPFWRVELLLDSTWVGTSSLGTNSLFFIG